jgi:hypothetical protein
VIVLLFKEANRFYRFVRLDLWDERFVQFKRKQIK